MIFLDDMRISIKRDKDYFHKYYEWMEREKWYCPICKDYINGDNNSLIYLGEQDHVNHIHNKFIYKQDLEYDHKSRVCGFVGDIPQIYKLIDNTSIKTDGQTKKIVARDGFKCQVCGYDDKRALEVHHIVPRSSPFVADYFKRDPINCITLCANCHRIHQKILRDGGSGERQEAVRLLGDLNGWNMKWFDINFYESHKIFKKFSYEWKR